MKPETQANVYWSSLLQKWIGEVVELSEQEHCVFHKENVDWNLVMAEVSNFLQEQSKQAEEARNA
jgi:hypothetical protein